MNRWTYFAAGFVLGAILVWLMLFAVRPIEALGFTHKKWDYFWGDWSECRPAVANNVNEHCGPERGIQVRHKYKKCVFALFHNTNCQLGQVVRVDTERRPCVIEHPPCEHLACRDNACVLVQGEGEDECKVDRDCHTPTKRWCFPCENGKDLVRVNGNGHEFCAEAIPKDEEPKIGFPWEQGMDKWCEFPPEPEPEGCTENCGEAPGIWSPPEYGPPQCVSHPPKAPTAIGGRRIDNDTVELMWHPTTDDGISHQIIQYGCTEDNLEYGIPSLPWESASVNVDSHCAHVWFRVGAERDYCLSWSGVVDP